MKAASRLVLGLLLVFVLVAFNFSSFTLFASLLVLAILTHFANETELLPDELFRRCARIPPDARAWHELFRRYEQPIKIGICKVIGFSGWKHSRYFEEVQQEMPLRLLANNSRAMQAFRGHTEAEARWYLRCIATNVALNVIRREKRHTHSPMPDSDFLEPIPPQTGNMLKGDLDKCLHENLSGRNKMRNILMFKLFAQEDLKPAEIARIVGMGMSAHAIEIQIGRTRAKLRKCFGEE